MPAPLMAELNLTGVDLCSILCGCWYELLFLSNKPKLTRAITIPIPGNLFTFNKHNSLLINSTFFCPSVGKIHFQSRNNLFYFVSMQSSPSSLYLQSVDKQRILVIGNERQAIVRFIRHVLSSHDRKFDISTAEGEQLGDASVVIAELSDLHAALDFKHHILIISELSSEDQSAGMALANATPKSGSIIFDEANPVATTIAKVERTDTTVGAYSEARHVVENGKIVLITSTNERFATHLTAAHDLKNINAAKDVLKKIGISSGQFYRAIATF